MKSVAVLPHFFVELVFRHSLSMSLTARRFQEIMAILKTWWQEGQHALCDAGRGCLGLVSAMFIVTEYQGRGTLHVHSLLLTREELECEMSGQSVHPPCADQSTRWAEECTTGR